MQNPDGLFDGWHKCERGEAVGGAIRCRQSGLDQDEGAICVSHFTRALEMCIVIHMPEVRLTPIFSTWLGNLRDRAAHSRIIARLRRVELGNLGDVKPIGEGVGELRIDYGPGYRLYFVQRGEVVVIMLCGGDKKTQKADITTARKMAKEV
jgi:putative addiction module killer protein